MAVRVVQNEGVNQHIGRAGVKGKNLFRLGRARKNGDVGDAAEIERDAAKFCVAIEKIVRVRDKRRALAAEGDVRGTKIPDGRDAGKRSDDGGLANLKRRGRRRTEI